MRNRSKRLIVSSILVIVVMLVSAYTVLAGSDFYESSYNGDYYNCRSKCYSYTTQSRMTSQSSSMLCASVNVRYEEGGTIYYRSGLNNGYNSATVTFDSGSGITMLSAQHRYFIGGTQVYYTTTQA